MSAKFDNDILTAYVLGELKGDRERNAIEKALAEDETLRARVDAIRAAADYARTALTSPESSPSLSDEQRETVLDEAGHRRRRRVRRWARVAVGVAAAAGIVLAVVTLVPRPLGRRYMSALPQYGIVASPVETEPMKPPAPLPPPTGHHATHGVPHATEMAEAMSANGYLGGGGASATAQPATDESNDAFAQFDYSRGGGTASGGTSPAARQARTERLVRTLNNYPAQESDILPGRSVEAEKLKVLGYIDGDGDGDQWDFEKRVRTSPGTESYEEIVDNPFKRVQDEPLSTFSIDVDTASYSNMRRFLNQGQLPPKSAVRIEELVNYFDYDYAPPRGGETPFAAHVEVATCPWAPEHQLARVALKGWEIEKHDRPETNLVFLIDVSGSMQPQNKLPLLVQGMKALTKQLDERDRVAIAVYAGNSGLVLDSTPGHERQTILDALGRLRAGGSTNGGEGIQLAYRIAREHFAKGGVNRVILATDGDFNVGITDQGDLTGLIEREAKSGVFLTVLGFGMGNLKDSTLEKLADKGNGNYAYIDTFNEARKVLVEDLMGTLVTIAKDVKIQIEFNPSNVGAYRLIGYENRMLAKEDFNDDTKDAGEIGAGHTVTALYELVPVGVPLPRRGVDPLRYGEQAPEPEAVEPSSQHGDELFLLKLRFKRPAEDTSSLIEAPVKKNDAHAFEEATGDFKFAAAVASFGMLLRDSQHRGTTTYESVLDWTEDGIGNDAHGYRTEFFNLVKTAAALGQ